MTLNAGHAGIAAVCLHIPEETKLLMEQLLSWSKVIELFCERRDPAICVEHVLPHLHKHMMFFLSTHI